MNDFLIRFVGIVMFVTTSIGTVPDAQHLVFPLWDTNRRIASTPVAAHIPYIAFTTDSCGDPPCVDHSQWGQAPIPANRRGAAWAYLPIKDHHLSVENVTNPFKREDSFKNGLPRLKNYCDDFVLRDEFRDDTSKHARKGATMDLAAGVLNATGDVSVKNEAVVTEWFVVVPDQLEIVATPYGGGPVKRLRLKHGPDMKVEIGNAPEPFILNGTDDQTVHNHFLIYYAVSKTSNTCRAKPGPHAPGQHAHPVTRSGDRLPAADCSNTGYP